MGHFRRRTSNKKSLVYIQLEKTSWVLAPLVMFIYNLQKKRNKNTANVTKPSLLWIHFTTSKVFCWQYLRISRIVFSKTMGSPMGPKLTATHLGTWTNLLGGWELDKVLSWDPRRFSHFFPPFFFPSTENPHPCYGNICLLVGSWVDF